MKQKHFGKDGKATYLLLIEAVNMRPSMFVGTDDFAHVATWLHGVAWGLQMMDPELKAEWGAFNQWLSEKLGYARNTSWNARIFLERYPDGKEALSQLANLYREFAASLDDKDEPKDG